MSKDSDDPLDNLDDASRRVENDGQTRSTLLSRLDRDLDEVFHPGLHFCDDRKAVGVEPLLDGFKPNGSPLSGAVLGCGWYGYVRQPWLLSGLGSWVRQQVDP